MTPASAGIANTAGRRRMERAIFLITLMSSEIRDFVLSRLRLRAPRSAPTFTACDLQNEFPATAATPDERQIRSAHARVLFPQDENSGSLAQLSSSPYAQGVADHAYFMGCFRAKDAQRLRVLLNNLFNLQSSLPRQRICAVNDVPVKLQSLKPECMCGLLSCVGPLNQINAQKKTSTGRQPVCEFFVRAKLHLL